MPGNAMASDWIAIRKLGLNLAALSGLKIFISLSTFIPLMLLVTKYETIYRDEYNTMTYRDYNNHKVHEIQIILEIASLSIKE